MSRVQDLPVDSVMTPRPTCLDEGCSVSGALSFLNRERYQSAPVADRTGRVVGLVTRNGLFAWLCDALAGSELLTLRELTLDRPLGQLVEPALRLPTGTRLAEAARRLVDAHAPAALVTRDDEVVGIVSLLDCARALAYGDAPTRVRGRGHCFSPDGSSEGDDVAERALLGSLGATPR